MRRWVLIPCIGMLVGLFSWTVASADGGPHGGYSATTDACAGCHRTHTAVAPKLLVSANTALCQTCHGSGATGADTNVWDGVYEGTTYGATNAGLNGGGFVNAKMDTSLSGSATAASVTSRHSVQLMPDYSSTATMWGDGAIGSGAGTSFDLYCTSCHDPHGSPNYRLIKTTVNGTATTVSPTDEAAKSYTTPTYYEGASQGTWEISAFCSKCHGRYMTTTSATGEINSGDPIFTYRHRIDVQSGAALNGVTYNFPTTMSLPVSSTGGTPSGSNRVMVCLTCHVGHGTAATMGPLSNGVPYPNGATTTSASARSSLLRLNSRGICENCHNK